MASKTPKYDAKISEILDQLKPGERTCELAGEKWMMDETEIAWLKKFNVPPSRRAPLTRVKHMSGYFTNFQWWYHKHPETGEKVISGINPNLGIKVLPDKEWFAKDFTDRGRDYQLKEPFFDQLFRLQLDTPVRATRSLVDPENSIALTSFGDQNSYFMMACKSKGCLIAIDAFDVEDSGLMAYVHHATSSYNLLNCNRIHNSKVLRSCYDCIDSAFLFDCRNCQNCFGATNKRNKQFLFFNEQLSEDEWHDKVSKIDLGKRSVLEEYTKKFHDLMREQAVWPENFSERTENSTGEYLTDVTNVKDGWFVGNKSQNCQNVFVVPDSSEEIFDCGGMFGSSNMYMSVASNASSGCKFCYLTNHSQDLEFCIYCNNCENCFGCVSLQRKKFCIFNKQYTEEEYWQRVDELKCAMLDRGEYGEYLPLKYSASYFPESGSRAIFHTDENDAKQLGAAEFDPNANGASGFDDFDPATGKTVEQVPDSIGDFKAEEWAGVPVFDQDINRQFAYLKPEIEWYQRHRIAPPNKHFISRLLELQGEMNTANFEDQTCDQCSAAIRVGKNFAYPDRKVYCRECYLKYLETNG